MRGEADAVQAPDPPQQHRAPARFVVLDVLHQLGDGRMLGEARGLERNPRAGALGFEQLVEDGDKRVPGSGIGHCR